MSELHFTILPASQRTVWDMLVKKASFLQSADYYLAGGTALALQLGHRLSVDFDFFSEQSSLSENTQKCLEGIPGYLPRDVDADTLHAEIQTVKLSFIGAYKYPLLEPPIEHQGILLASILDIGVMKLLAISHRATVRDYIDLAAIIRSTHSLSDLLHASIRKYGNTFNPMIPLRALVSFEDLANELPILLDTTLASSWKEILRNAVRKTGRNAQ